MIALTQTPCFLSYRLTRIYQPLCVDDHDELCGDQEKNPWVKLKVSKSFKAFSKISEKNISCAIACMIMLQNAFNHAHTLNPWDNWQFELHFKVPAQHFPPLTFTSNFHCHLSKQIGYMGLQGFKINVAPWKHLFAWLHWMPAGNKIARNWKSKV